MNVQSLNAQNCYFTAAQTKNSKQNTTAKKAAIAAGVVLGGAGIAAGALYATRNTKFSSNIINRAKTVLDSAKEIIKGKINAFSEAKTPQVSQTSQLPQPPQTSCVPQASADDLMQTITFRPDTSRLDQVKFNKGQALNLDGTNFDGVVEDITKSGKKIELTYKNGVLTEAKAGDVTKKYTTNIKNENVIGKVIQIDEPSKPRTIYQSKIKRNDEGRIELMETRKKQVGSGEVREIEKFQYIKGDGARKFGLDNGEAYVQSRKEGQGKLGEAVKCRAEYISKTKDSMVNYVFGDIIDNAKG